MKFLENYNRYSIREWAYDYIQDNHEGFNELEDAIDYLDWFFESIYPTLLKDEIILYRIVALYDIKDLDESDLGIHYTLEYDPNNLQDYVFYEYIGLSDIDEDQDLYLIEVKVNKNDIDLEGTIINRLSFPREEEITLKNKANPEIINIKEIYI